MYTLSSFCTEFGGGYSALPDTAARYVDSIATPMNVHLAFLVISGVIGLASIGYDTSFLIGDKEEPSVQNELRRAALLSLFEDGLVQAMAWLSFVHLSSNSCYINVIPQMTSLAFALATSIFAQLERFTKVIAGISSGIPFKTLFGLYFILEELF